MRIDRSFVKGSAIVGVGNVVAQILNFIFFVVIIRMYTKSEFGWIRYTIVIATLATVITTGFPRALARYLGKYKDSKNMRDVYFSNTVVAVFFVFMLIIAILLIFNKLNLGMLIVMTGLMFFEFYFEINRGFILPQRIIAFKVGTNITKIIILIFFVFIINSCQPLIVLAIFGLSCLVPMLIMEIFKPAPISFKARFVSKKKLRELSLL
ncbi:MAG: oligosaccharide flippase family protein, partial [Candidatus Thermoplasmatota archaeon]|nr:oligosaccharide flippase family protein [Candidatus Thermoplasmatota archaeon]